MKNSITKKPSFKLKWLGKTGSLEADFSKLADKNRNILKIKTMKFILKLIGNCNEFKGKLKQKIALFTGNDGLLIEGKQDEVIGRIQAKRGKSKQEILNYIAQL